MQRTIAKHKSYWSQKTFAYSAIVSFGFFLVSLITNYFAGIYVGRVSGNVVPDIILSNFPVINTNFVFLEGFLIFLGIAVFLMVREPKRIPFILKSIATFIIIRSIFIMLTHIGPSPDRSLVNESAILSAFTTGADLFFSAHTGLPFLFALMFWDRYYLRIIFLAISIIAGVSVLLSHMHYSIDVAAAFFITHSIFIICKRFFKKDFELFHQGLADAD